VPSADHALIIGPEVMADVFPDGRHWAFWPRLSSMDRAELAEDLMAYIPLPPSGRRAQVSGGWLTFQPGPFPHFANVSAVRVRDDTLDVLLQAAVDWFATQGRSDCTWFLGPSTTPRTAVEWLLARGSARSERATAMWLDVEPALTSAVQVRTVNSPETLLVYREMAALASGIVELADDTKAAITASNPRAWADLIAMEGRRRNYLALIDDQPVAAAGLLLTDRGVAVMAGGATLPQARGRGCYRALVRARWDDAAAAGSPNLVVQASDRSGPILAAMGFRRVAELTIVHQTFS
jgi:hypothetical protein